MKKESEYLIDKCLPSGRVHLLAGPSGAGKTTLLFQMMQMWINKEPVLGFETRGQDTGKFFYIATDHPTVVTEETMRRVGVPLELFGHFSTMKSQFALGQFFDMAPADTKILFVEGTELLIENGKINDNKAVGDFLRKCSEVAEDRDMAIWLSTGAPKMKKGEEYINPRERILGSIAWGRYADTVFVLGLDNPGDITDPNRTLYVYPRNHPASMHRFQTDSKGRLQTPITAAEMKAETALMSFMQVGLWYERAALVAWAETQQGVSRATLDRMLAKYVEEGLLERNPQERGQYRLRNLLLSA